MKISIITCTFNRKEKLIRNIRSVLDQEFDELEQFIIDDGSTDDTLLEIKKHNFDHLRIISLKTNLGQPAALIESNVFNLISGDIHFLLDSDDYLLPGAIKKIKNDADKYFSDNKKLISINYSYEENNKSINGYTKFETKNIFKDDYARNLTNKGFKDYLSVRNKIYLNEQFKYFRKPEDWYLSYYHICAKNEFQELFTSERIYNMDFSDDTVTRGLNIEKYSKWSLNTRKIAYEEYKTIMGKIYKQYTIKSLFFNYLVNSGNNLNKFKLLFNEKIFFVKNFHFIILLFISLIIPSNFILKIKKFLKKNKKVR